MSGTIPLKIRDSKSGNLGSGTRNGTRNSKTRHPGPRFVRRGIAELNFAGRARDKIFSGKRLAPVHNNSKPGCDLKLDQSSVRADLEPSYDSKMLYLARIHFLCITIFSNTKLWFLQSWSLIFARIPPKKVPTTSSKFLLIGWSRNVCERSLSGRMISDLIE